jgi:hypothetical protein
VRVQRIAGGGTTGASGKQAYQHDYCQATVQRWISVFSRKFPPHSLNTSYMASANTHQKPIASFSSGGCPYRIQRYVSVLSDRILVI